MNQCVSMQVASKPSSLNWHVSSLNLLPINDGDGCSHKIFIFISFDDLCRQVMKKFIDNTVGKNFLEEKLVWWNVRTAKNEGNEGVKVKCLFFLCIVWENKWTRLSSIINLHSDCKKELLLTTGIFHAFVQQFGVL